MLERDANGCDVPDAALPAIGSVNEIPAECAAANLLN